MTQTDPGFSLDMFADIGLSLGGLKAEIQRWNDRAEREERRARQNLPRQVPLMNQSTNATSTDILVMGEGPVQGKIWEVRLLAVFSNTQVVMGTTLATWYVGQKMPGPAAGVLPAQMFRWQFSGLPGNKDFSGDQIRIQAGEDLICGLTGIPAAPTQITAIAVVDEIPAFVGRPVTAT